MVVCETKRFKYNKYRWLNLIIIWCLAIDDILVAVVFNLPIDKTMSVGYAASDKLVKVPSMYVCISY